MSFLDESASLLDALAFLDAYDLGLGPMPLAKEHESSSSSSTGAPSSPEQEPQHKIKPTTAPPKLRHRDRMKAEALRLQREAEALEAMLAKLKADAQAFDEQAQERWRSPGSNGSGASKWKEIVVHEYRSRRKSEITNRKLKVLLAKQLKMVKASEGFLQNKVEEEDLTVLYEAQRTMVRPNQTLEGSFVREMLAARVNQLKLNVDKHMIETGLAFESNFMFRTQRKIDSTLGPLYETVANTPLPSSMEHTDNVYWHGFMKNLVNGNCPQTTAAGKQSSLYHVAIMGFDPDEGERKTRGTMLKDVQADRVVYLYSSLTPYPSKNMNCIEDWVIVVRRTSAPATTRAMKPSSMIQTWYRAFADQYNTLPSADEAALEPQNERVLRFRSSRIGGLIQIIEAGLLGEAQGEGWKNMPTNCPFSIRA